MRTLRLGVVLAVLGAAFGLAAANTAQAAVFSSEYVPGYCLDVNMSTRQLAIWNCHGGSNQNFDFSGYGAVRNSGGCLDTQPQPEGRPLVMHPCNNAQGQRWGYDRASHQFRNEQGWCADIQNERRDRGTPVIAWKCGNKSNQHWRSGRVMPASQAAGAGLSPAQVQQLNGANASIDRNGGSLIGHDGASLIGHDGASIVATGAGNFIKLDR